MLMAALLGALLPQDVRAADARDQIGLRADPDWIVIEDVRDGAPPTPSVDGIRYLLVSDQVNIAGAKPVWHRRMVYEADQQRGLASAGQFTIEFQPDYQQVQLHAVDIWRGGVRHDRRAASRIEMLRRESDLERGLIDGRHTISVTIPDLRVGDRVDYRFSIEGFNPVFGGDYHDVYSASYSTPLANRRVRMTYPARRPLEWQVTRDGYRIVEEDRGQQRVVDLSITALARQKQEPATPDSHDGFGSIRFSTTPDWGAVARWASPLYPARFSDRERGRSLARKLALDPADQSGSLIRAIAFAQGEVRYTGLDMGQNSHAPNAPELTLDRRFGDCKDKAVLLVALLAEAGIQAEPVLVNTMARGRVGEQLPSPLAFDHVVVRAFHDGRFHWIDPTRDRERGPIDDRDPLPFGFGLPVHDRAGILAPIPNAMPPDALVDVHQSIALLMVGDDVSAAFEVVTRYAQGHAARVRNNFANNGEEEVGEQYERYMRDFYDGIRSTATPSLTDSEERDLVQTKESYQLAWNKEQHGSGFGVVLFQLSDWMPDLEEMARKSPLSLSGARSARQTIRVSLSQGWAIQPQTEKVENPYFSFVRTARVDGGDLVVRGDWRRMADEVPAKDYALVQRDFVKARELLEFNLELNTGLAGLTPDPQSWRWPVLSVLVLLGALSIGWRHRASNAFAGMLFCPRRTMISIGTSTWTAIWILIVLSGVVSALVGPGSEYLHDRGSVKLATAVGEIAGYGIRLVIGIVLLRWALKLLSAPVPFRDLLGAGAWGHAPPFLLLMGCAVIAVGGNVVVFADAYDVSPAQTPGVVMAGAMAIAAICWMFVSSLNAYAIVAGTSRRRVAAAIGLLLLALLLVAAPIGLLMHFN